MEIVGDSDPCCRNIRHIPRMANSRALGAKLKALRQARGLKQVEAAEAIGIRRSTLAGIETGGDLPGRETLFAIARFYAVSLDDLEAAAPVPSENAPGEFVNDPDELAWLRLWRAMESAERVVLLRRLGAGLGAGNLVHTNTRTA
jgi:transcriptional regulator with XRE-family HTH domain